MSMVLKAPFPWFGGKSAVADVVWQRFGPVRNYVEPFFGSGAVLLMRPAPITGTETVNDKDSFLSNFWRALQADPDAVAHYADWTVNENDLHARHAWMVQQKEYLTEKVEGCPEFYDAKIAGWWVWGLCCWIGTGFCSGNGPWNQVDGRLVNLGNAGQGVNRQLPHLGNAGRGVNRQLPHLGDAGRGVNRQLPHLGDAGRGDRLREYFQALSERLRSVRVASGDWSRVTSETVTTKLGTTAMFLDPPYLDKCMATYNHNDDVRAAVRAYCLERGDDPAMRIALCGYDGEHEMPESWSVYAWKTKGGYGSQAEDGKGRVNRHRERIWFSPHCLPVEQQAELAL